MTTSRAGAGATDVPLQFLLFSIVNYQPFAVSVLLDDPAHLPCASQ
jgi:hypothetical protein